jgi:hypothetical protein
MTRRRPSLQARLRDTPEGGHPRQPHTWATPPIRQPCEPSLASHHRCSRSGRPGPASLPAQPKAGRRGSHRPPADMRCARSTPRAPPMQHADAAITPSNELPAPCSRSVSPAPRPVKTACGAAFIGRPDCSRPAVRAACRRALGQTKHGQHGSDGPQLAILCPQPQPTPAIAGQRIVGRDPVYGATALPSRTVVLAPHRLTSDIRLIALLVWLHLHRAAGLISRHVIAWEACRGVGSMRMYQERRVTSL